MTRVEDRRVRRTRSALQTALFELVVKRDYETITVADICEAADVGRSAFYQHFKGKDDLLRTGFAKLKADLGGVEEGQSANFSAAFLEHAIQHRILYRALMRSQAAPIVSAAVRRILVEKASNLISSESRSGAPRDLRAILLADIVFSLTLWWFDRDARLPVCDVEAMFAEMAAGVLGNYVCSCASCGQK